MRDCKCLSQIDKLLATKNARLVRTLELRNVQPSRPVLRAEQIETGRGKAKAPMIIPTYCPFCGAMYPTERP